MAMAMRGGMRVDGLDRPCQESGLEVKEEEEEEDGEAEEEVGGGGR